MDQPQNPHTGATPVETPPSSPPQDRLRETVMTALEALLFAADEPLALDDLRAALSREERPVAEAALGVLMQRYQDEARGLQIIQVAGGYRMTTRVEHDRHLRALYRNRNRTRVGPAALETLAIIAYRQPITAPEIGDIRGKDPGAVLKTLLDKHLIRTRGRRKVVGRPFLYGTTREFLVHFGLNNLEELPSMEEFNALLSDTFGDELVGQGPGEAAVQAGPAGIVPVDGDAVDLSEE